MKTIFCLIFLVITYSACKKDENLYDPKFRGTLELGFDNVVSTDDLTFNTGAYTNASGETVTVLRYYSLMFTHDHTHNE